MEDNKRRLNTVSEQLPSLRAEFAAKEKRLQEVEQHRAALQDQNALMSQENRSLRARSEEFVANASKLNRQLSDLQSRRDDLARRVEELEATLAQETAAHAKLKAAHLDAAEAHRLTASNLREELSAMTSRSEAAERLLAEARETLRERDAEIRGFEQRALETSLALKSKDVALADLEKDLTAARALHAEVDTVRAALDQRSVELAKALEAKDAALQRAEQKIVMVEGRIAEQNKAIGRRARGVRGKARHAQGTARGRAVRARLRRRRIASRAAGTRLPPPRREGAAAGAERTASPGQRNGARQDRAPAQVSAASSQGRAAELGANYKLSNATITCQAGRVSISVQAGIKRSLADFVHIERGNEILRLRFGSLKSWRKSAL